MPILYFSGAQVAFFESIEEEKNTVTFGGVKTPFQPSDVIEIEVRDKDIKGNGEFKDKDIEIQRFTVIRDGERHEIRLDGVNIKGSGGKGQGDTYLTSKDEIAVEDGPFGDFQGKMVFSSSDTFATGETTSVQRKQNQDLNEDEKIRGSAEKGDGTFNAASARSPPCFATGTRIATPLGLRNVEEIKPGDCVTRAGGGTAVVLAAYSWRVRFDGPDDPARPVRIAGGALGRGVPTRELILSPQHCLLAGPTAPPALRIGPPALARAKALTGLPGIRRMRGPPAITFHALLLMRHGVILAEGTPAESLWPGREALRALSSEQRAWLSGRIPGLSSAPEHAYGPRAAPCLTVQETRRTLAAVRARADGAAA